MEQQTVPLKVPFKDLLGNELKMVTLRGDGRIKVGDLMAVAAQLEAGNHPASLENVFLVARMCGLDVKEIEGMDSVDFNGLVKLLSSGKA